MRGTEFHRESSCLFFRPVVDQSVRPSRYIAVKRYEISYRVSRKTQPRWIARRAPPLPPPAVNSNKNQRKEK